MNYLTSKRGLGRLDMKSVYDEKATTVTVLT